MPYLEPDLADLAAARWIARVEVVDESGSGVDVVIAAPGEIGVRTCPLLRSSGAALPGEDGRARAFAIPSVRLAVASVRLVLPARGPATRIATLDLGRGPEPYEIAVERLRR